MRVTLENEWIGWRDPSFYRSVNLNPQSARVSAFMQSNGRRLIGAAPAPHVEEHNKSFYQKTWFKVLCGIFVADVLFGAVVKARKRYLEIRYPKPVAFLTNNGWQIFGGGGRYTREELDAMQRIINR